MKLKQALRANPEDAIAFTGAGETTAAFTLAREHVFQPRETAWIAATTHLSEEQARAADLHITAHSPQDLDRLNPGAGGLVVITSGGVADGRYAGVREPVLTRLARLARDWRVPLLIEADGSRRRPLKAPAAHEPDVPGFVDAVVVTAGLSGLGRPAAAPHVHRPEIFCAMSGLAPGSEVSPEAVARVLAHPQGGLKGIPADARRIALLNQADSPVRRAQGGRIAAELGGVFNSILVASLRNGVVHTVREPTAAIVLAAGGSSRIGAPKQLLDWRGRPLVAHIAGVALQAGCDPVIVVTGAERGPVHAALGGLPVQEAFNPDWEAGQSTSVQAGIRAAGERAGAALFLLVDQPFVDSSLIRSLIDAHARSLSPIVAPLIDEQRGNPVLFDRTTFPAFDALKGDAGGRQLFARFRVEWVPWHNALALRDIDTREDYEELLSL